MPIETPSLDSSCTIIKSDANLLTKADKAALGSNALMVEDRFSGLYEGTTTGGGVVIQPKYNPDSLTTLVHSNNTLMQCITAMEVNIDGTGYDLDMVTESESDAPIIKEVDEFLKEPYPSMSMTTIRRKLRRDVEITGNAYLEVIRNGAGAITLLSHIPSVTMRLCRLIEAPATTKELIRGGKKVALKVAAKERRYVQKINGKYIYFKNYGTTTTLNKTSGEFKSKLPLSLQATEIIHFTAVLDGGHPYGVPRWINQTPSVLGSRKAEEHNLEFFNSGGLPPVLITISGGMVIGETKKALENYLNGKGAKNRAAILEAYASGTSLDSNGSVKITVERFGAERQNDSMFEKYDANCEARIRASFRLPELYVGRNTGNFAASRAASMLAEAQVFIPERAEFDEIMNLTIIRELSKGKVKYTSRLHTAKDGNLQMKGIAVARSTGAVAPKSIVDAISDVAGLNLKFDENELALTVAKNKGSALDALSGIKSLDAGKGLDKPKPEKVLKSINVDGLAYQWGAVALGESDLSLDDMVELQDIVNNLEGEQRSFFEDAVSRRVFPDCGDDTTGAYELANTLAEIEVLS